MPMRAFQQLINQEYNNRPWVCAWSFIRYSASVVASSPDASPTRLAQDHLRHEGKPPRVLNPHGCRPGALPRGCVSANKQSDPETITEALSRVAFQLFLRPLALETRFWKNPPSMSTIAAASRFFLRCSSFWFRILAFHRACALPFSASSSSCRLACPPRPPRAPLPLPRVTLRPDAMRSLRRPSRASIL